MEVDERLGEMVADTESVKGSDFDTRGVVLVEDDTEALSEAETVEVPLREKRVEVERVVSPLVPVGRVDAVTALTEKLEIIDIDPRVDIDDERVIEGDGEGETVCVGNGAERVGLTVGVGTAVTVRVTATGVGVFVTSALVGETIEERVPSGLLFVCEGERESFGEREDNGETLADVETVVLPTVLVGDVKGDHEGAGDTEVETESEGGEEKRGDEVVVP